MAVLGKEKIIDIEIKQLLFETGLLIPEQFGFRTHHTTTMQEVRVASQTKLNMNIKHITSMVLLDIGKAFEVVWHEALVYKKKKICPHTL